MRYIYQLPNWPNFVIDSERLLILLGNVRSKQGRIIGKMEQLGFNLRDEAVLETLTLDVLKTSEIEGKNLDNKQVRSSLARRLGLDIAGLIPSDRDVDGIVEMLLDATTNSNKKLTKERLFAWHSSLFPSGISGMQKIIVGNWRDDSSGPMQIVSGSMGKENVHFQAPDASVLENEMSGFIAWFNSDMEIDAVLKAGISHLWFVTLHPFEDGNGRIARALSDMLLSRADGVSQRFYSMSAQIRKERKEYYNILEFTQKGSPDITGWLEWFLNCLQNALTATDKTLSKVINKHKFWTINEGRIKNQRQKIILNKLLDKFEGKLNTSKWAKITKCSQDTALRDIQDLLDKSILKKSVSGGRSTSYELNDF